MNWLARVCHELPALTVRDFGWAVLLWHVLALVLNMLSRAWKRWSATERHEENVEDEPDPAQ